MGTYFFSSGEIVEGYWENDEKTGKGVYRYSSNYSTSPSPFRLSDINKSPSDSLVINFIINQLL